MRRILVLTTAFLCTALGQAQDTSRSRISGMVYVDYFYNMNRDSALATLSDVANGGAKGLNGFQLRRIYFTYDRDLSPDFMFRFRLEADGSTAAPNGKLTTFLKDAFLRWKNVVPGSELYVGLQPTPAFEISESAWGYRSLEKTIMDLRGTVAPRDIGISIRSRFEKAGSLNYWFMFGNNSNNTAETDKYKRLYGNFQWILSSDFQVTAYGDYSMRSPVSNPNAPGSTMDNDVFVTGMFAGYGVVNDYMLGVEGFFQTTQNGLRKGSVAPFVLGTKYGLGVSVFAYAYVEDNVSFVGRYDFFDPNIDQSIKGDLRHYMVFGLSWKPDKNVAVTPNVLVESYEQTTSQTYVSSITGRVTFFVTY